MDPDLDDAITLSIQSGVWMESHPENVIERFGEEKGRKLVAQMEDIFRRFDILAPQLYKYDFASGERLTVIHATLREWFPQLSEESIRLLSGFHLCWWHLK